ncbi:unnamed protein product [Urochloa humidicola]
MDAAHWQQSLGLVKPMEEMLMAANAGAAAAANASNHQQQGPNPNPPAPAPALRGGAPPPAVAGAGAGAGSTERRARPQKEKALNCPRCNSTNTKFCYYNNYSLQQPRYFCKTCRRYWTEGGSLRNVPVGGGSRKNKRSSSSSSAPVSASASASALTSSSSMMAASTAAAASSKNPKLAHEGAHDLNLAFPHHHGGGLDFPAFPSLESSNVCGSGGGAMAAGNGRAGGGALSAMELLRSSGCYMPLQMPMPMPGDYGAGGFALGEFRAPPPPSQSVLGFSLDAHGAGPGGAAAGYGAAAGLQGVPESAGRLLFPFEDLKPPVSSGGGGGGVAAAGASGGAGDGNGGGHPQFDHSKEQGGGGGAPSAGHDTPGFWNGMIGGSGASW